MNNLLVVITYRELNKEPCMTSAVVPVQHSMSLETYRKKIEAQYKDKPYYNVTITEI